MTIECPRCADPVLIPDAPHEASPTPTRNQIAKTQKIELPPIPPSRSSAPLTPRHTPQAYSQQAPAALQQQPARASHPSKNPGRVIQQGTLITVVIAVLVLGIALGMFMALRH